MLLAAFKGQATKNLAKLAEGVYFDPRNDNEDNCPNYLPEEAYSEVYLNDGVVFTHQPSEVCGAFAWSDWDY